MTFRRLDNNTCTASERRKFLRERTGKTASGWSLKRTHVNVLEKLDQNPSFKDFMDLPAEARLMIYEYLLPPKSNDHGQNAILTTCKLVGAEVEDLLYTSQPDVIFSDIPQSVVDYLKQQAWACRPDYGDGLKTIYELQEECLALQDDGMCFEEQDPLVQASNTSYCWIRDMIKRPLEVDADLDREICKAAKVSYVMSQASELQEMKNTILGEKRVKEWLRDISSFLDGEDVEMAG